MALSHTGALLQFLGGHNGSIVVLLSSFSVENAQITQNKEIFVENRCQRKVIQHYRPKENDT